MLYSSDSNSSFDSNIDEPNSKPFTSSKDGIEDHEFASPEFASLGYSAPVAPLNPNLKSRLFESLGLETPESDIVTMLNWSIQELKAKAEAATWLPMNDAPGFDMAVVKEKAESRTMACFIRADQPGSFPEHYHPAEEVVMVLGGDLIEEGQTYRSGDRIHSAACTSHSLATTEGCLLFCIASMDNEFLPQSP